MKNVIHSAMFNSDEWVIQLEYHDSQGRRTNRVVSPIRYLGEDRFLALCLCREEPRQFRLERCKNVSLMPAHDVLMPVPMS